MFVFSKEWREGGGEGGRKETSMGQTQGGGEEERIEECKGVSPPPVSWGEGEVKGMHRARQVGSIRVDQSGPAGWLQTRPTPRPAAWEPASLRAPPQAEG